MSVNALIHVCTMALDFNELEFIHIFIAIAYYVAYNYDVTKKKNNETGKLEGETWHKITGQKADYNVMSEQTKEGNY